jgi:hypothetical protein
MKAGENCIMFRFAICALQLMVKLKMVTCSLVAHISVDERECLFNDFISNPEC